MAKKANPDMAKVDSRSADHYMGGLFGLSFNLANFVEIARNPRKMTREQLCHLFAGCVSLFVITPLLFVVTDRRDPIILQDNGSYITPYNLEPGQPYQITYKAMESRSCDGEISIRVTDSTGHIFPYAVEPTVYRKTYDPDTRTFVKSRTVPLGMAAGPATYTVSPVRWCNAFQQYVWPIKSHSVTLKFNVVRPE